MNQDGTETDNHLVYDISDELKGEYPKDFKFVGWHPFCRCFATPRLADRFELNEWARMTDKERKGYRFKGTVDALPKQFNAWVKDNTERITKVKTLPYFLKDNKEIIERAAKLAVVHHEVLTKATNDLPYIHNFIEDRKSIFTTKKKYANGGKVMMMNDVDKTKSDYNSILTIANYFARQGKIVKIPSQIHFKSDDYKRVFGKLIGTKYERKCPDIIVDEKFIEFEGFIKPWTKKKVGRMLSHGLQQSNCIIIDNNKGCSYRFIRKAIMARLHLPNQDIKEVWIYEKGKPRLFFKDGQFYKRQQEG